MATACVLGDEQHIVTRARRDHDAFAQLFGRYHPLVHNYVHARTGDQDLAEDVAAQTMLLMWRGLERYTDRGLPFSAWVYRIAANELARATRRRTPRADLDEIEVLADSDPTPEEAAAHEELRALLWRAATALPTTQCRALLLHYSLDQSIAKIADSMGLTQGATKQLLQRGRNGLRARIAERGLAALR